jgi:hypothetical protein
MREHVWLALSIQQWQWYSNRSGSGKDESQLSSIIYKLLHILGIPQLSTPLPFLHSSLT